MHLPRHGYVLRRILTGGSRADWSQFLSDTWDPVCRFARRYGGLAWPEAREIAVSTFETLVHHDLLQRWARDPSPELRKLMCSAACNAIAARLSAGGGSSSAPCRTVTPMEEFFTAWADHIHSQALDRQQAQYYRAGRGNDFERFEDGVEGVIDVARCVRFTGVFAPLRERTEFAAVQVSRDLGTVCWPCGADLDPDVLYALVTGSPVPCSD